MSRARFAFDGNRQLEPALDPETARAFDDESLHEDSFKGPGLCSRCGPKFCLVHNFRDVDRDAAAAMAGPRREAQAVRPAG
jgi:phosphomethylpyrimidine synthase